MGRWEGLISFSGLQVALLSNRISQLKPILIYAYTNFTISIVNSGVMNEFLIHSFKVMTAYKTFIRHNVVVIVIKF